jgi:hypothetical protein
MHLRQQTLAVLLLAMLPGTAMANQFPDRSALRGSLIASETPRIPAEFRGLWGSPREACRGAGTTMTIDTGSMGISPILEVRGYSDDASSIEVTLESGTGKRAVQLLELSANAYALRVSIMGQQEIFYRCSSLQFNYSEPRTRQPALSPDAAWQAAEAPFEGVSALISTGRQPGDSKHPYDHLRDASPRFTIGCSGAVRGLPYPRFLLDFTLPKETGGNIAMTMASYAAAVARWTSAPGHLILEDREGHVFARHIIYPTAFGLETGPMSFSDFSQMIQYGARFRVETPWLLLETGARALRDVMPDKPAITCLM